MSDDQIRAAEFEVERARSRLIGTLNELTRQFEPHRLIEEVWEKAKGKGADLADRARRGWRDSLFPRPHDP